MNEISEKPKYSYFTEGNEAYLAGVVDGIAAFVKNTPRLGYLLKEIKRENKKFCVHSFDTAINLIEGRLFGVGDDK